MEVGQFSSSVKLYVYMYMHLITADKLCYGNDANALRLWPCALYMLRLLLYVPDHGTKHNFQSSSL